MKHFSAQFIFTNTGSPLKRGVITCDDDGTIINIEDTGGDLQEKESVEFHNGVIIPGFVNCHCHLELSHLKGCIPRKKGLAEFIKLIRKSRDYSREDTTLLMYSADYEMYKEGIELCADICNTSETFGFKKESRIHYINLLEVFGIDPEKAKRRLDEIIKVSKEAEESNLPFWLVPHSVYSLSLTLFRLYRIISEANKVTAIHFMESDSEKTFLNSHSGPIMSSYTESGLGLSGLETVENHVAAILNEITPSGNLILVHNTYADREIIRSVKQRENLFWCLCPNSNIYIEDKIPPLDLLIEENCEIVIGTDSLASNTRLSILEELKTLQKYFPWLILKDMVRWATINGAKALGKEELYGKIEPGKNPGLLLIQNIDLQNMKLLPESNINRLL
jgi:cytosine/adenosine deaminase-related metal-dependent hydrolase